MVKTQGFHPCGRGSTPLRVTFGFKLPLSLGIQVPQLGGFGSGTIVKVGAVVIGALILHRPSVFACIVSIMDAYIIKRIWARSLAGKAPPLQGGEREFDSHRVHHIGATKPAQKNSDS